MPACRDCPFFGAETQRCLQPSKPGCATRSCVHGFVESRLIGVWGDVLEVGAGVWRGPRRVMASAGAVVYACDPRWRQPVGRAYRASADALPFPDARFDFVVAIETMEHWEEGGHDTARGVAEVLRVLRPGGVLLATVPIHLHGSEPFVLGDLDLILGMFKGWGRVEFEPWRQDHAPLPECRDWKTEMPYAARLLRKRFRHAMPVNWMLEIRAHKGIGDEV